MNELKSEDVMKALECCVGNFHCNKCPRKNDEYHCVKTLCEMPSPFSMKRMQTLKC